MKGQMSVAANNTKIKIELFIALCNTPCSTQNPDQALTNAYLDCKSVHVSEKPSETNAIAAVKRKETCRKKRWIGNPLEFPLRENLKVKKKG